MRYSTTILLLHLCSCVDAGIASNSDGLHRVTFLPRGGWNGGKKESKQYRESLEQEILTMGRQLRKARDEVAILRDRKKKATVVVRRDDESREKVLKLEEENEILQGRLSELEAEKSELSSALQASAEQVSALDSTLANEMQKNDEAVAKMRQQIHELKASADEEGKRAASENEAKAELRIAQAIEEATMKAEADFAAKIQSIEEKLQKDKEDALESERIKSVEAVEAERKKMRKLVKALAQREKQLSSSQG